MAHFTSNPTKIEDDRTLRHLIKEVVAWPEIEPTSLPVDSTGLVSLRADKEVATADRSVFITGREFGRVLFGAPTIYLSLPSRLRPLGNHPGMGRTSFFFPFWSGSTRRDGDLRTTRRT